MKKFKELLILAFMVFLLGQDFTRVEACSCMRQHPQQHFCMSDFVILARVRKEVQRKYEKVYKINIKKEFKMTDKARSALKAGKIFTPLHEAACGVDLGPGISYVITGKIRDGLQAQVYLCNFVQDWRELSRRQRKGFRMIYGRGCDCQIKNHVWIPPQKNICSWKLNDDRECYQRHGICLKSPSGICKWTKSLELQKCLHHTPKSRDSRRYLPPITPGNGSIETLIQTHHHKPHQPSEDTEVRYLSGQPTSSTSYHLKPAFTMNEATTSDDHKHMFDNIRVYDNSHDKFRPEEATKHHQNSPIFPHNPHYHHHHDLAHQSHNYPIPTIKNLHDHQQNNPIKIQNLDNIQNGPDFRLPHLKLLKETTELTEPQRETIAEYFIPYRPKNSRPKH